MSWVDIIALAIALAADALAVSIAAGAVIGRVTGRHVFRIAFHFGLFQFMMPVIGWVGGRAIAGWTAPYAHWIAAGLLSCIGVKMIVESFSKAARENAADPSRGWMLVSLSVATSIDALAVGVSMALMGVNVFLPAVVIGVITASLCVAGICTGGRLGRRYGSIAVCGGGIVLLAIAVRVVWSG